MSITMKSILCAILALILISAHCTTAQSVTTTTGTSTAATGTSTAATGTSTAAMGTSTAATGSTATTTGGNGAAWVKPEVALLTLFGGLVVLLV